MRSSFWVDVRVAVVASALIWALPGCDCAGNTTVPGFDGGDGGGVPDAPRRDGEVDAPSPTDGGGCVPVTETCDGTDEDCDGLVDEAVVEACGSDVGACVAGVRTCTDGTLGVCVGEVTSTSETCDDGIDQNCDGSVDEGCACTDGDTQSCGFDVGECASGTQTCAGGLWGTCVGEAVPSPETCDGLDNDCDGVEDDLFVDLGMACDGSDTDACTEGVRVCSADGASTTCDDTSGDSAEVCSNGLDDDCDGSVDEGCTCSDGATQPCGTDVGACMPGTQTCSGGSWGSCAGATGPTTELCNSTDDDCDGSSDETFVTGGACDGSDADLCTEGALACDAAGGVSCTDTSGDTIEVCNGTDDDCDTMTDESFMVGAACDGPDADRCAEGVLACDSAGGASCNDTTGDTVETCNDVDDDCDGNVDEGNPGGGVACAGSTDVGACIARTACVGGAIVCRGTFVSPTGTATATGASNDPLPSISAAIANAGILGGGADVCVCDLATAGASTFTENVTMVEGTSVLGAYDCATWSRPGGRVTAVQDVDVDGLTFPAGITSITVLEQMTVDGFDVAGSGGSSAAVTITDASPTLANDTVRAGDAATAIGLRVVETAGASASPTVTAGTYTASGIASGTAIAVSLESSSPRFSGVTIGGAAASGIAIVPTTGYGVRCLDCGGTTFMGGTVASGGATTNGYGLHGTGDLAGLAATMTVFGGGPSTMASSSTFGVRLEACRGAPTFTNTSTGGGGGPPPATSTRTAFSSSGASCAPVVDGGRHIACERGVNCYGIEASTMSPIVVRNAVSIAGTVGTADLSIGVRCTTGACASITGNTIAVGPLSVAGAVGIGLELDGASPVVDDNSVTGPNIGPNPSTAMTGTRFFGVYLRQTTSVLTNNLFFAGNHNRPQVVVQYDQFTSGPALIAPTIHSNTIEYASCTTVACNRIGLVVNGTPGTLGGAAGVVRNNIIRHVGVGGITRPVEEANTASDLQFFENNALFDPGAVTGVYLDEGTTGLMTAAAINGLTGASANQIVDCMLNASWHIPVGSACRNTGTATGAPDHDFDPNRRPAESMYDIGADEFVP